VVFKQTFDFRPFMARWPDAQIWQPFTYMWLHATDSIAHILVNLFMLYMFGGALEQAWGSQRFLRFYLACGVFAGVLIIAWDWLRGNDSETLGASGAIFGVLTAYSLTWPNRTLMLLFPPIPIRAIYMIPLVFVLQLLMEASGRGPRISHVGHLGGVIAALILLRGNLKNVLSIDALRYRWHRYRMRGRLRAVQREEWQRRNNGGGGRGPTVH